MEMSQSASQHQVNLYRPNRHEKPLPSFFFVNMVTELAQASGNSYDKRIHVLHIKNTEKCQFVLKNKYNRTIESFFRQLQMIGFRNCEISDGSIKFKWEGDKEYLIRKIVKELEMETHHSIETATQTKDILNYNKRSIDEFVEKVLFNLLTQQQPQQIKSKLDHAILSIKSNNNATQDQAKFLIERVLNHLSLEMELYRLLADYDDEMRR